MKKAVSYLRVSSAGQCGDDKDGLPRQRDVIARYAAANDIEIVDEFSDQGLSGKLEMENRPGLAACLERVENNGVKLVIVEDATRLARSLVTSEVIISQFQKAGVTVISASGGVDLTAGNDDDPTAQLIRQILGAVAHFDRAVTVLKLRAARERKRKANGKCEGAKSLNEQPEHAALCQRVYELAELYEIRGRIPIAIIGDNLYAEGFVTRKGTRISETQVRRILSRRKTG